MSELKETGETFSGPGPHFNPNDKGMIYVDCSLEQDKAGVQRGAKSKSFPGEQETTADARSGNYRPIKKVLS
jgi:hypothetical protein